MIRRLLMFSMCALAACSRSETPRVGDTGAVVVAEVLESNATTHGPPMLPPAGKVREAGGAHFFTAFIIDTTGRVEAPSISFVGTAPEAFRAPLCATLTASRFQPVRRGGVARRALVIRPFDYRPAGDAWTGATAGMGFDSARTALVGHGADAAMTELAARPHCSTREKLRSVTDTLAACPPAVALPAAWTARTGARTRLSVLLPADYQAAQNGMPGADAWTGTDSSVLGVFYAPRGSLQVPTPRPAGTSECRGLLAGRPARIVTASRPVPGGPKDTMYFWGAESIDTSATPLSALVFARSKRARDFLGAAASRAKVQQP